jgi:flagella basal body P-ring formation protein FlgA
MQRDSLHKIKCVKMTSVLIFIILGLVFLMSSQVAAEQPNQDVLLKIHLPREVSIEDESISLADISILKGDETAVHLASDIALGKFSVPCQQIIIDRATISSRLASHGYPTTKVLLTGSSKVNVKRKQNIILSNDFVQSGQLFLKENPIHPSLCHIDPVTRPKDLALSSGHANFQLIPRLLENKNKSQARVRVGIFVEGREIETRDIDFRLKFESRKAVTIVDVPAGAIITADNIKIEKMVSDYPEPADWKPPYGLVTKRPISANSVIDNMSLDMSESTVVVERNQNITIRVHRSGLIITAIGMTLQKGRVGEYIRVRNIDSKRIIVAKVCEDGTVEPVF